MPPEQDQAMAINNMYKKFGDVWPYWFWFCDPTDKQTYSAKHFTPLQHKNNSNEYNKKNRQLTSRVPITLLWLLTDALNWLKRGREWKYSTASSSDSFSTVPSTRTCNRRLRRMHYFCFEQQQPANILCVILTTKQTYIRRLSLVTVKYLTQISTKYDLTTDLYSMHHRHQKLEKCQVNVNMG